MPEQMHQNIAVWLASGLYVEQYCKEQYLKASTYYYFRKKIVVDRKQKRGKFIQLQQTTKSRGIKISFANGIKIYILKYGIFSLLRADCS